MKSYFDKKVWLGFITAIAIISWFGISSFLNNKKSADTARWVAHTNRVLYHSEEILALTVDLESGQRGFALTGMEEFLEPTIHSANALQEHFRSLRNHTSDNQSQLTRVDALEDLLKKKLAFVLHAIDARKKQGLEKVLIINASLQGKKLMDRVRVLVTQIQNEEHQLLEKRAAMTEEKVEQFNAAFGGMLFATVVILALVFYMIHVNLKARKQAENSLREASDKIQYLYDNAPCGYHSIDNEGKFIEINKTWLEWVKYDREDVVGKMYFEQILTPQSAALFKENFKRFQQDGFIRNGVFEVMRRDGSTFPILLNSLAVYDDKRKFIKSISTVLDYTEQKKSLDKIELLNQELESFAYSVSHDLRAPLRSIDGYTQILLEDFAHRLDDEGKRVLNVVVNNARRMGTLIDDLLDFSRVGRKDLVKTFVNTENMVQSVLSELKSIENGRLIEAVIHPLEACEADPNLLRQIWVNLISNALKYTRKRSKAEIEISSQKGANEIIFKIKDNGTGFDMQYSHKLFGVFQRLHRQQDFEGTGVGLAIVHRIVTRHGGRVWAEGEIDKGAAFYFTLPQSDNN
jgi:PAS domain S-box-containing protein